MSTLRSMAASDRLPQGLARWTGAARGRSAERGEVTSGPPPAEVAAAMPLDPPWTWPALAALLVVTAVGYLSDLSRNGWGNAFYAAAVQAGTKSWKAFFFGSSDWSNFITIKILCTLAQLTSGSARVAGHDVVKERDAVRRSIGLVFQDPTLDSYLTGAQNLAFHAEL